VEENAATDIKQPRPRPLNLADAMIFIIALALGIALARPVIALIVDAIRYDPRWRFQTLDGTLSLGRMLNIVFLNFLIFLLPAFLIVRLRRPRPAFRSLLCQPGFVACAAPVVIVLATIPLALFPSSEPAQHLLALGSQVLLAAAAPLAWVFLIATHRWNPEPSWIDRLGRILGVLLSVCSLIHFVLIRLPY
jgi:hypothetical protein